MAIVHAVYDNTESYPATSSVRQLSSIQISTREKGVTYFVSELNPKFEIGQQRYDDIINWPRIPPRWIGTPSRECCDTSIQMSDSKTL